MKIQLAELNHTLSTGLNQIDLAAFIIEGSPLVDLRERIEENERNQKSSFSSFMDMEMIYYYINKPNHIDREKDKSMGTKLEYSRDLLQFFGQLQSNVEFLRQDNIHFDESSLFRNLRRRNVLRYHTRNG